jgi:dTMP kinase
MRRTSTQEAPGYLLTFEGGEGGGKGTQIEGLVAHLQSLGYAVTQTREPGGTRIGDAVRRILLDPNHRGMDFRAELMLYEASRAQLLREVIHPALAQGHVVVCDRFSDSTTVYQGYARGIDLDVINQFNTIATGGLQPDCTVLLDLDPVIGLQRIQKRTRLDRLEGEALAFHERVRHGYRTLAAEDPERFLVIDASQPPDHIQTALRTAVVTRLCHVGLMPPDLARIHDAHGERGPSTFAGRETEPCPTIRAARAGARGR